MFQEERYLPNWGIQSAAPSLMCGGRACFESFKEGDFFSYLTGCVLLKYNFELNGVSSKDPSSLDAETCSSSR